MSKNISLTRRFEFSASHRYWNEKWSDEKNEELFGLCISPFGHGHNYELHVTISGAVDPVTGMIVNLTDLKKYVQEVLLQFDHKYLNLDNPLFKDLIPTTENIAHVLFNLIDEQLQNAGEFKLARVKLYERHDLYVDVWRSDK